MALYYRFGCDFILMISMKNTKSTFFLLLTVLIFLSACLSAQSRKSKNLKELEYELFHLVNKERKKANLKQFTMNNTLQKVARAHSKDMEKRDFFSHTNPDGESPFDRMKKAGLTYMKAAENIAYNSSVKEIHRSLMNSPGHRKNIMNPQLGSIGIGIVNSKYGLMATQVFKNPD